LSILLLDVGNSRLKWAFAEDGLLTSIGGAPRDGVPPTQAAKLWFSAPAPTRIVASNVAGSDYAAQLSEWCEKQWGVFVEYVQVDAELADIELAYSKAQNFGVDRWLALVAAQRISPGNVCVIDCGTAVTIDLLTAQGKHQGGVILPGLQLMQNSLLKNTDGIKRAKASSFAGNRLLGNDTWDGIILGSLSAVAGAIELMVSRIKSDMAMPISCVVTGGDAAEVLKMLGKEYQYEPNLVLLGMKALVAE